jgi:hypothetical protein
VLFLIQFIAEMALIWIIAHRIVAGHCGVTFLEPANRLGNLLRFYQPARRYPLGCNRSNPSLSGTPMGFAALYPSYPKTTDCRIVEERNPSIRGESDGGV